MFSASTYLVKTFIALSLVLVSSMVFGIGKKKWDPKGKVSSELRVLVSSTTERVQLFPSVYLNAMALPMSLIFSY